MGITTFKFKRKRIGAGIEYTARVGSCVATVTNFPGTRTIMADVTDVAAKSLGWPNGFCWWSEQFDKREYTVKQAKFEASVVLEKFGK